MTLNFPKLFRRFLRIIAVLFGLYILSLIFVYFKQERFFFNPKHLEKNYTFTFKESFEELNIPVTETVSLNALLFKTEQTKKGVIIYFHGNAGAIHDWGKRAPLYLNNGYDILFFDYRGYGKSDGEYSEAKELFNDGQAIYNYVKKRLFRKSNCSFGLFFGFWYCRLCGFKKQSETTYIKRSILFVENAYFRRNCASNPHLFNKI